MGSLQRPVVVVGMHRSGTSLTAAILVSAGLHLGEKLTPASHANAEDYFEDLEFVSLHRAALEALGHDPDGYAEVVLGEMPGSLEARAQALVDARAFRHPWGWKDPRTTLFLPFWERLLPQASFVFVYRSPWEVIDSLYRRGDLQVRQEPAASARLWSHYNSVILGALSRMGDRGRLFDLDDIVACPGAFVQRVSHVFGLELRPPQEIFKPELLRRGDCLADWRDLAECILPTELALLRRLDAAAQRLADRAPARRHAAAPGAPQGALLREWAALRAAERALADIGARDAPQPKAHLQLFVPVRGIYSESASHVESLGVDGQTRDFTFLVHCDGSAPLRFDTGQSVGIVEITALSVQARATGATVSWSGSSLGTAPLRLANAVSLGPSHDESLCFLSLSGDPQVYVDVPDKERFAGACQVDITVGFLALTPAARPLRAEPGDAQARQYQTAITELRRRLLQAARALEVCETTVAEHRAHAVQWRLKLAGLQEALASSETRLDGASRALEALQQGRAYRLGRLVLAPWRWVRSVAEAWRRPSATAPAEVDAPLEIRVRTKDPEQL